MRHKEYCEHCDELTPHVFYNRTGREKHELARCKKCNATTRLDLDKPKPEIKPQLGFGI